MISFFVSQYLSSPCNHSKVFMELFCDMAEGYFSIGGKLASSLYRAVRDTFLGIIVGIIILSILLSKKVVGNSTAALQLAAVRIVKVLASSAISA